MFLNWNNVEGSVEPLELDETSSDFYVYIRKNIRKSPRQNEDGSTTDFWVYDEAKISKDDYEIIKGNLEISLMKDEVAKQAANIEYIAMMTEVDLDE